MQIIHLADMMEEWKKGLPFSVTVVTCDMNRDKGGEILELKNVKLAWAYGKLINHQKKESPSEKKTEQELRKNPKHYDNGTQNLLLENGLTRKIHVRLVMTYNGKKVFY
jgi:hypothetical protein